MDEKRQEKLDRMIDDAAFVTYPSHVLIQGAKFTLGLFFIVGISILAVIGAPFYWMVTAKSSRADLIEQLSHDPSRQVIRLSDLEIPQHDLHDPSILGQQFDPEDWLAAKSNVIERACVTGRLSLAALQKTLDEFKPERPVPLPPVVRVSFFAMLPSERNYPADQSQRAQTGKSGNWFTGVCLAVECMDEDLMPRNTSIWADLFSPQMTPGQEKAINVLYATGTPDFWVAAAHANGIVGHDKEIEREAVLNQIKLRFSPTLASREPVLSPSQRAGRLLPHAFLGWCFLLVFLIILAAKLEGVGRRIIAWVVLPAVLAVGGFVLFALATV
jgi:hypothetical protein